MNYVFGTCFKAVSDTGNQYWIVYNFCQTITKNLKPAHSVACYTCLMFLSPRYVLNIVFPRWVHLLCALYTPDVAFVKPEQLQCVTLSELPQYKWGSKVLAFACFYSIGQQSTAWLCRMQRTTKILCFIFCFVVVVVVRIVTFVKTSGSVGQGCALNVTLACVGHTFMSHGEYLLLNIVFSHVNSSNFVWT